MGRDGGAMGMSFFGALVLLFLGIYLLILNIFLSGGLLGEVNCFPR
ncbi:MAG: hypothetical protein NTY61_01815 [Candidatus Parcubacteria bacterium]|nr:hypothetical protein [Candidatus Parcubacteria bacterium]